MRPRIRKGPIADQSYGARVEPITEFSLTLDLPPSTNKLYQKIRGGGLALSAAAKKYRNQVKNVIGQPLNLSVLTRFPVGPDRVYMLQVLLYFPSLENPGWFEFWEKDTFVTRGKKKRELKGRKGERKAKTRYKVVDYDNRIKFMQDCLADSIGINDCQIFRAKQEKREDPVNPRAEVFLKIVNREEFF